MARGYKYYEAVEKNAALLGILIFVAVSFGGLAEIVPLFIEAHTVAPPPGVKPYDPLRLAGKDIYVREGCYLCHSQMIRALRAETQRYGTFSVASESVYDRPFQWGSKRTGPDLARVGGKYSDEWQRLHLVDPRAFVPESNMPPYPWLEERKLDGADVAARMRVLRKLGDPYTDADIAGAPKAVADKTELDALVAYLQGLGIANDSDQGTFEMSPLWGHIAGIVTAIVMLAFIGIWVWAWLPYHKPEFDALATLPMEDGKDEP